MSLQASKKAGDGPRRSSVLLRGAGAGCAAALLLSCSSVALRAETSNADLAKEIAELKAQIREMRGAMAAQSVATKRAVKEVKEVKVMASHGKGYALPPPTVAYPAGAVPAFITADKKLQFGAITITPGGFLAGESVFRSRTTNSDINSAWGSIPLNNNPLSRTNEYRLTGRQSRLALLAEGAITPSMIASGYAEFDFLGAGTTSNATDTNSYAPRIRQLYAALDMTDYGIHAMAGQMWSLTTINSKGITPRNEVPPPTIDGQFLPGFIFARQAGVRLTKDFDRKLWLSVALEEAQTTFPGGLTGACQGTSITDAAGGAPVIIGGNGTTGLPANVQSICAATASGAGFSQYGQPYSLNHLPDIIGKIAYEAKLGERDIHVEGMGLYKDLYNATYQTGTLGSVQTHDVAGYGFGGGVVVPVLPKTLDFQMQVMTGRGIGRYGAGLLPDSTIAADGSLKPIGETMGMAGFTLHATPSIDVYAYGGIERENRAYSSYTNTAGGITNIGYGVPDASNFGCGVVNAPSAATCSGQTQQLWSLTGGFWDKLYKGSFGEVRVGAQYSYTQRDVFATQASATAATTSAAAAGLSVAQASRVFSPKAADVRQPASAGLVPPPRQPRMKSQMFAPFVALLALAAGASTPRAAADDGAVSRGAYLVAIAACAGCHTPRGPDGPGPALSGGRVFGKGPNAAISANITPDRETGIGTWTDAQIATAIHAGTRPDGSRMGAPMPQIAYRAMRDDDVRAIVAYLRSVPAVANAVPHATRTVATPRAMPPATMAGDDPVARGRYLANAVTHCTECHTPGPPDAPDFAARLDAGGRVFQSAKGPLVAPPITAESLRRFSDAELGAMIAKGRRPDGSTIEGPMPVAAYAHLTTADLDAIIAYLRKG